MMDDRLNTIVRLQREFQTQLLGGHDPSALTGDDRAAYFQTQAFALMVEVGEASNEIGWKPWATSRHINSTSYRGELIDAFHFLLNLMLLDGMTADDIHEGYVTKQRINRERQVNGYTGTAKCPGCHRAYDDPGVSCGKPLPQGSDLAEGVIRCGVYGLINRHGQQVYRNGNPVKDKGITL